MKKVSTDGEVRNITLEIPPHEPKRKNRGKPKIYDPKFALLATQLVAAGFEEKDLAYVFGCAKGTINSWKKTYPEFKAACIDGKRVAKKQLVAQALLSAVGYDYKTKKTRTIKDANGVVQKIEETEFDNKQPGNDRLLTFILCNLDRQLGDNEWRSINKMEIENKHLNVQITGEIASEQIQKLAGRLLSEPVERKTIESKQVDKS